MKKYGKWILILIGIIVICGIAYFFWSRKDNPNSPLSNAERLSTEINTENEEKQEKQITETEISSFSTDIIIDDNDRDTNLKITASKINNTIVKNGEEFSFNDIVGNPTPDKGYKEAGIFVDGEKEEGYGGGNCQISTTIYDAVLKVKELEVTERHEHGKDVGYVEEGKDATVAYDYLDFKFKNNTGYDIKIYAEVTEEKVTIKIMKLAYS